MNRREFLHNGGMTLAASGLLAVAGCSGDGGDSGTTAIEGEADVGGALEEKLAFDSHDGELGDETLELTVGVTNVGDEPTDPVAYNYLVFLVRDNGAGPRGEVTVSRPNGDGTLDSGDTAELELSVALDDLDRSAVSSYKLHVQCSEGADGAYCQA